MEKDFTFTETVFTSLEPKRTSRLADECLIDIRLVEYRRVKSVWVYEYEVKGASGNVEKFLTRVKHTETVKTP